MKVKKVRYSRGVTLNIGDFENVRIEMDAEADLDDETFVDGYRSLKKQVDDALRAEVEAVRSKTASRDQKLR